MKKHIYTIGLLLFISIYSYSQISFGPKHYGKPGKFKEGTLATFKATTTIFVFSDTYEKEVYENMLKDTWTVTPYKIVHYKKFNPLDYGDGQYSFAKIGGFKRPRTTKVGSVVVNLNTYFDILMYDFEAIHKKLKKLNQKKAAKKLNAILLSNEQAIARFYLYADKDFVNLVVNKSSTEIATSLFNNATFYNYKPGLLKNYFQKINQLISDEDVYWMYAENSYTDEILNLTEKELYIIDYSTIETDALAELTKKKKKKKITNLYDVYEYQYTQISSDKLNEKILQGEEVYYLRYVRVNDEKFIDIVNSKTGAVIYRNYMPGIGYTIKPKHLKELNKTIKKVLKKQLEMQSKL